jgi:hypothetical protein
MSEALMVFPTNKNCLIDYLSIPRGNQNTIADVHAYANPDIESMRKAEGIAESTVSWFYNKKSNYSFSLKILNRVVNRLTFFGKFEGYDDFENHFKKWSGRFDAYIGQQEEKIPYEIRKEITRLVYEIYRAEEIYLKQVKSFNNSKFKGKEIRLTRNYLIVILNSHDCVKLEFNTQNVLFDIFSCSIEDSIGWREGQPKPIIAIIDAHCCVVSFIEFHTTSLIRGEEHQERDIKTITCMIKSANLKHSIHIIDQLAAKDISLYFALLYFVDEMVVHCIDNGIDNKLILITDKLKFISFGLLTGFNVLTKELIAESSVNTKVNKDEVVELRITNGLEIFYITCNDFDKKQVVNLSGLEKY